MSVKEQFMLKYQGKDFVTYPGLLDTAHEKGLKSIITDLLQIPSDDNGKVAIVRATVEMDGGRVFTGLGDAGPNNAGKVAGNALIRMAETRAKARALRDAVNIGVTSLEETDADEPDEKPAAKPTTIRASVTKSTGEQAVKIVEAAVNGDQGEVIRRERLATLQQEVERKGRSWEAFVGSWKSQHKGAEITQGSVDELTAAIETVRGWKNGR